MEIFENIFKLEHRTISYQAEDKYLQTATEDVLSYLKITDNKIISSTSIIFEEAFVNVCHYSKSPEVKVTSFWKDDDSSYILLEDTGIKFNPLEKDSNPYSLDDFDRIGGLGILMIKKMCLNVYYQYMNNENQLLMEIKRR